MKNKLKMGLETLGISNTDDSMLDRQLVFAEELLRWNKKINLTAITAMEDVVEKHLLDSLILLPLLQHQKKILDIGSGAGLPVIPLAIAMPDKQFLSVDSVGKKVHFQKHVKRLLGLTNLEVHHGRIEGTDNNRVGWSDIDVVVARALGRLDFLLDVSKPILKPGGILLAMKGPEAEEELRDLDSLWRNSYKLPSCITPYQLPFSGAQRCLIKAVRVSCRGA